MNVTTKCHGDFTVDNILVHRDTGIPVLIDPSDDNILKGPLFDISRLMQSLLGGYEFLNSDGTDTDLTWQGESLKISYLDLKSQKYDELATWLLKDILPNRLHQNEIMAIQFHLGVLYARMLTHRLVINENSMYKYLAVSIQYLNKFYEEVTYENE